MENDWRFPGKFACAVHVYAAEGERRERNGGPAEGLF